jgi:hypothetical protein
MGHDAPTAYNPHFQNSTDKNWKGLDTATLPYINSLPSTMIPQWQQAAGQITNNPYAGQVMQTAHEASTMGQAAGQQALAAGGSMNNLAALGASYAPQIMAMGFDPQHELYDRELQRQRDQAGATAAMYGVASSPYGAGVAAQGERNFNLDWGDRQLGRALQSIGGYGQLTGAVGGAYGTADTLNRSGLNTYTTAGMLPYQTSVGMARDQLGALGALQNGWVGSLAPAEQRMNDYLQYLAGGRDATRVNLQADAQSSTPMEALAGYIGQNMEQAGNVLTAGMKKAGF